MHVLMVVNHACVRVMKEAVAVRSKGHRVDVVCSEEMTGHNRFDTFSIFHDADQLRRTVSASPADIIHVHNEPDWLVDVCKDAVPNKPVVFDVHDLESLRWQREPDDNERRAFAAADGFVHVSDVCAEAARAAHPVHAQKPTVILPCYINEEFYKPHEPIGRVPAFNTIVYEGALTTSGDIPADAPPGTGNFRGLEPIVSAFLGAGFEFHLYPARPLLPGVYENMGAVLHQPLHYPVLLRALRSYGYGFLGSPHHMPLMDAALPNKLFEYMSQGVVPIVYRMERAARFVRQHEVGIVLDDLTGLDRKLPHFGMPYHENVQQRAREWSMERNIDIVTSLYEALV